MSAGHCGASFEGDVSLDHCDRFLDYDPVFVDHDSVSLNQARFTLACHHSSLEHASINANHVDDHSGIFE